MTDYSTQIGVKFEELNYTPRERQVQIINEILNEFIDKDKQYVVLSASTGIGKSLISLCVSELLSELTNEATKQNRPTSFIVAHTNTLLEQYEKSYSHVTDMLRVNGSTNYSCEAFTTNKLGATGEDCITNNASKTKSQISKCINCEYMTMKKRINKAKHIITNNAYIFTSLLYSDHLDERLITVWDECHSINNIYVDFLKIEILPYLLKMYAGQCSSEGIHDLSDKLLEFKTDIDNENIDETNYLDRIDDLSIIYTEASSKFREMADIERVDENFPAYKKFNKISKKFANLAQKIDDFFELGYEHVTDITSEKMIISPIFMKDMFSKVNNSSKHLFMSATIDESYISQTLNLKSEDVGFINGGSIFKPSNKKIINCQLPSLNYNNMKNQSLMSEVHEAVNSIVSEYDDCKGVILATSFYQINNIKRNLKQHLSFNKINVKIFSQEKGMGLKDLLEEFINFKGPSVLISPSLFEGISLDHDLARYLIYFKSPYPSLGDKRNKYILNNYADLYEKTTVYKVIQGIGRAVRDVDDWCDTFLIDGNLKRLLNSKHNLWKNEYELYKR